MAGTKRAMQAKRVLLVEDNPGDADLIRERASEDEHRPVALEVCETLAEALESASCSSFDLVVLDLGLPDSEGIATFEKLHTAIPDMPVIVLTGHDDQSIAARCMELGAHDFLVKGRAEPFITHAIYNTIVRASAQRALREAQAETEAVYEHAPVYLLLVDGDLRIRRANRMAKEHARSDQLNGLHPSNALRCVATLNEPDGCGHGSQCDDCVLRSALVATLEQGRSCRQLPAALTVAGRDGLERQLALLVSCAPIVLSGARMALLCLQDVTEMHRAEQRLESSEQRYRLLAENSTDVIALFDAELQTQYISPSVAAVTGIPADELAEMGMFSRVHPDDVGGLVQAIERDTAEHKKATRRELRYRRADGSYVWLEVIGSRTYDEGGTSTQTIVNIRDISERKRVDEALRGSEERYRALFDSSADAIMTLAPPSWRFTSGNAATLEMFDLSDQAVFVSAAPWDVSPPTQPDGRPSEQKAREMIEQAMQQGSHFFEWQYQRGAGKDFPATVLLTRMTLDGRSLLQATVRDVTEVRALQAHAAQADRLTSMGMLAAGVAHEINNPLAYLLYNLESLTEELPELLGATRNLRARLREHLGPKTFDTVAGGDGRLLRSVLLDDMRERFEQALEGGRRIRDIARSLSTFSRVERDRLVPVDLNHVIDVASDMALNEIKYRARLVKDFGNLPFIMASEGRLSQVFLNLLINAAHAIEEGHVADNEIRVRTREQDGDVIAEVWDSGSGIAPEHIDRLFEPFFTTKKVGVGSGLGLAISKNIVKGYGGDIAVTSELGTGTTITVRLPVREEGAESQQAPSPADTETDSIRGRVLVVDDEQAVRAVVVRLLKNHETVTAQSGAEAKRILRDDRAFDLVLCDMMMSDVSGLGLHEWLADEVPRLAKRLVFITGGAFTPRARAYLKDMDNVVIEKPFDRRSFNKLVTELIRSARSADGDKSAG